MCGVQYYKTNTQYIQYVCMVHINQPNTCLQWYCDVLSPVSLDDSPSASLQLFHDWSVQRLFFYSVTYVLKTTNIYM